MVRTMTAVHGLDAAQSALDKLVSETKYSGNVAETAVHAVGAVTKCNKEVGYDTLLAACIATTERVANDAAVFSKAALK